MTTVSQQQCCSASHASLHMAKLKPHQHCMSPRSCSLAGYSLHQNKHDDSFKIAFALTCLTSSGASSSSGIRMSKGASLPVSITAWQQHTTQQHKQRFVRSFVRQILNPSQLSGHVNPEGQGCSVSYTDNNKAMQGQMWLLLRRPLTDATWTTADAPSMHAHASVAAPPPLVCAHC